MKYNGSDRMELTNRFAIVYNLLVEKGEIRKNHATKSKAAFAEKLLGSKQYGHILNKFLNQKRQIDYKHARILCNEYGVNNIFQTIYLLTRVRHKIIGSDRLWILSFKEYL